MDKKDELREKGTGEGGKGMRGEKGVGEGEGEKMEEEEVMVVGKVDLKDKEEG